MYIFDWFDYTQRNVPESYISGAHWIVLSRRKPFLSWDNVGIPSLRFAMNNWVWVSKCVLFTFGWPTSRDPYMCTMPFVYLRCRYAWRSSDYVQLWMNAAALHDQHFLVESTSVLGTSNTIVIYTASDKTDGASALKTVSAISMGGRGNGSRQIFSSSS